MPYYESELDYDAECHMKEQRSFQRYYNTPIEVDDIWFASLCDYDNYMRMKDEENSRLQKMTIDLKALIQEMVREEMIEKLFASIEDFPELSKPNNTQITY